MSYVFSNGSLRGQDGRPGVAQASRPDALDTLCLPVRVGRRALDKQPWLLFLSMDHGNQGTYLLVGTDSPRRGEVHDEMLLVAPTVDNEVPNAVTYPARGYVV